MIIKGPTMTGENEHQTQHCACTAYLLFIQSACAVHLLCSRNLSRHWNSSSQDRHSPLPSRSWHSWRACRVHQADTWTKRLIDDAREWNWVTGYDRGTGSGACFSEQWRLSWHLKNEKVLASKALEGNKLQGNKDNVMHRSWHRIELTQQVATVFS